MTSVTPIITGRPCGVGGVGDTCDCDPVKLLLRLTWTLRRPVEPALGVAWTMRTGWSRAPSGDEGLLLPLTSPLATLPSRAARCS